MELEKNERVITLRISRELHKSLKAAAKATDMSLNQYCAVQLRNLVPKSENPTITINAGLPVVGETSP